MRPAGQVRRTYRRVFASDARAIERRTLAQNCQFWSCLTKADDVPPTPAELRPIIRFSENRPITPRPGKMPRCVPSWARIGHDQALTGSFCGQWSPNAFLVTAGLLGIWLVLDVCDFRPVLARGWHTAASSSRIVGTCRVADRLTQITRQAASDQEGVWGLPVDTGVIAGGTQALMACVVYGQVSVQVSC